MAREPYEVMTNSAPAVAPFQVSSRERHAPGW